ncbi:hypothetical protein CASFOL_018551 [Castilleja foliolosa]|uniref:DUF4283 domain-containing protein n=1 Tax=Castilleja foliolosa TaxID=1961234 RepID=A0ABD3D5N8_9LAMI
MEQAMTAVPVVEPKHPPDKTYARVLNPIRSHSSDWFSLKPIPLTKRNHTVVDNIPTCIISNMELEEAEKQFEFALILKFTAGRPSLVDIKNHILCHWGLKEDPVVTLLDARHVLLIAENQDDMIRAQTHPSHRINASLFRIFRWSRSYDFVKDNTKVPVWVSLTRLPISYMNPTFLSKIGNLIGKYLRADEETIKLKNGLRARICVEVDVSKDLPKGMYIGDSNEDKFWQPMDFEGNN